MDEELPRKVYGVLLARLLLPSFLILFIFIFSPSSQSTQSISKISDDTIKKSENSTAILIVSSAAEILPKDAVRTASSKRIRPGAERHQFDGIIEKAAHSHKIDPALVKAIIMAESGYNRWAVSQKGARGLMQLMPETAESLGVEDIFNPEENINAGVKYFKLLMDRFDGNTELALAAYNAGSRMVHMHGGFPPFKATRHYVDKVFEYYERFKGAFVKEIDKA
ncbi:MAG: lytic transglycosylase domain-containing protein [Syntrophales bacterium]|nr:lytic transglycosylase domain-containing protein [Syntrophales bacterium]MDY0043829.1 lytic transglycosylase domain-containing protein [Syntrophales bacterium]